MDEDLCLLFGGELGGDIADAGVEDARVEDAHVGTESGARRQIESEFTYVRKCYGGLFYEFTRKLM